MEDPVWACPPPTAHHPPTHNKDLPENNSARQKCPFETGAVSSRPKAIVINSQAPLCCGYEFILHTKKHQTPGTSAQAQDPFQSENMSQGYENVYIYRCSVDSTVGIVEAKTPKAEEESGDHTSYLESSLSFIQLLCPYTDRPHRTCLYCHCQKQRAVTSPEIGSAIRACISGDLSSGSSKYQLHSKPTVSVTAKAPAVSNLQPDLLPGCYQHLNNIFAAMWTFHDFSEDKPQDPSSSQFTHIFDES
ncbi:hypothetical protein MG293_007844 [Ovis ammon polii]|uniref:Uncharacterized protein n=1 Tax=Ovis ammon polii TaxID=230172 RepID=A0AAD4UF74_OVIAM|nr:hypothetical protein MG293_007844 [Ovis ammon polii]KAI4573775.1 hypothetical protein MJT46_005015 [Ovis ammon polii x Ovis aries]